MNCIRNSLKQPEKVFRSATTFFWQYPRGRDINWKFMFARMLRYRSDIWEYTTEKGMGTPSIKQAVVYFYKEHDNRKYSLQDSWDEQETLMFSYKPIKVWEMKKEPVIDKKLLGLYPLLPLMEEDDSETEEEILEKTVDTIKTVENISLQADLFAVMSILVGEKFTSELVKKYVRRIDYDRCTAERSC